MREVYALDDMLVLELVQLLPCSGAPELGREVAWHEEISTRLRQCNITGRCNLTVFSFSTPAAVTATVLVCLSSFADQTVCNYYSFWQGREEETHQLCGEAYKHKKQYHIHRQGDINLYKPKTLFASMNIHGRPASRSHLHPYVPEKSQSSHPIRHFLSAAVCHGRH